LYCPLCGSTRALAALLRGDVLLALRCNTLAVTAVLWAAAAIARRLWAGPASGAAAAAPDRLVRIRLAIALLTLLFTVARNLPGGWFWWLRPD
jgi:hypothetical protein